MVHTNPGLPSAPDTTQQSLSGALGTHQTEPAWCSFASACTCPVSLVHANQCLPSVLPFRCSTGTPSSLGMSQPRHACCSFLLAHNHQVLSVCANLGLPSFLFLWHMLAHPACLMLLVHANPSHSVLFCFGMCPPTWCSWQKSSQACPLIYRWRTVKLASKKANPG